MKTYYFDHAASSWPKPESVIRAMNEAIQEYAANPGRGSHKLAMRASRKLYETRTNIAKLFNIHNPNHISFTYNTTIALNQAIKGFLKSGDHVITTSIEHNSVRRPLEALKKTIGIEISYLTTDVHGQLDMQKIKPEIKPNTRLFVCSHSSNLLGSILPLADISEQIKPYGIKLLVDVAQSAGSIPVDVAALGIDMLAFPGHKGLLGPQGTGGLFVAEDIELEPLIHGGTGSQSEHIEQPLVRPDRYEPGTQNTAGISGLNEGVKYVLAETVEAIQQKEWHLVQYMMEHLSAIGQLELYGPRLGEPKTGIVTFQVKQKAASEIAFLLDRNYNIAVRAGHHCSPLAHETIGTTAHGAVRASIGAFNTLDEIDYFIHSLKDILKC